MEHPGVPGPCWQRDFAGQQCQVAVMRRWLASLLPGCPALDDVLTVATELAANACLHSDSRLPGSQFGVAVTATATLVTVSVTDSGGPGQPHLINDPSGEHGHGLRLVAALSEHTEVTGSAQGRCVRAAIPCQAWTPPPRPGLGVPVIASDRTGSEGPAAGDACAAGQARNASQAAQAAALLTDHPYWAVWLPAAGWDWIAVRVAGSRPPGPGLPLLWASAPTAEDLARAIRALDDQVSAGHWP